jgi:AGCS family alanine or glycine:cation symporter
MILSMAFPNIIGGVILAPRVKVLLQDYWRRYKANEFTVYE